MIPVSLSARMERTCPVARFTADRTRSDHLPCPVRSIQCTCAGREDWYQGMADIDSFEPEELFGTKLRALLQRRKNRDLFDLNEGLKRLGMSPAKMIACFEHYLALEARPISRAAAEQRMLEKLERNLAEDIEPLLPGGIHFKEDDAIAAFNNVWAELIVRIKGDAWKLTKQVAEEIRLKKYPGLFK